MIRFCETHNKHLPDGYVANHVKVPDGRGGFKPRPNTCPGYGEVEYIGAGGWAELNRDECKIVEYERKQ